CQHVVLGMSVTSLWLSVSSQSVTEAANCLDKFSGRTKFLSQSVHMCIDRPRFDAVIVTPHLGQKPLAGFNSSAAMHQNIEQFEFDSCQLDRLTRDQHDVPSRVDRKVTDRHWVFSPAPVATFQNCLCP